MLVWIILHAAWNPAVSVHQIISRKYCLRIFYQIASFLKHCLRKVYEIEMQVHECLHAHEQIIKHNVQCQVKRRNKNNIRQNEQILTNVNKQHMCVFKTYFNYCPCHKNSQNAHLVSRDRPIFVSTCEHWPIFVKTCKHFGKHVQKLNEHEWIK